MAASSTAAPAPAAAAPATGWKPRAQNAMSRQPHMDMAFAGVLAYLLIEYTRLPAMFPILIPLQLGKVAVLLGFLGMLVGAPSKKRTGWVSLDMEVVLFLLAALLSAVGAKFTDIAFPRFADVVLQWGVVYVLVSRVVSNEWRLRVFMTVYLLVNLKLAQFSIRMYQSLRAAGADDMYMSSHGVGAGETGFFGNPGDFGVAMAVAFAFALCLTLGETKKKTRLLYGLVTLAVLVAVFLCGSRGALLAGFAVGALVLLKNLRRILVCGVIVALLGVGFYLLPGASKHRLQSARDPDHDETTQIRLRLWKAGWKMYTDHPVFGIGLGNFSKAYVTEYEAKQDFHWAPHSIYIEAISETGTAGGLCLLAMLASVFVLNRRSRKRLLQLGYANDNLAFRMSTALDFALVAYMVSGAFLTVLYYPHLWLIMGLTAGLHRHCSQLEQAPAPASKPTRRFAYAGAPA